MTTPVNEPQPATNIVSLPSQSPLTTISKTVGLNSIYSSLHSFADRNYRKGCAHFAEGIIRLTATAALTGLTIIASYEAKQYYLENRVENALDNEDIKLAMRYAKKAFSSRGFENIISFCLDNKDTECAINAASKISDDWSRDDQFRYIFRYCIGEENINCALKVIERIDKLDAYYTQEDLLKRLNKLCKAKGNQECVTRTQGKQEQTYSYFFGDRDGKPSPEPKTKSSKESGQEVLQILGIDSEDLLEIIGEKNKAEDKQFIEKKCGIALIEIHPDKSKKIKISRAFASFVQMCTNAVISISQ